MTNAERERAIQVLEYYGEKLGCKAEFDLAIKALEGWDELKETIVEMRDNNGTGTQQEVCKFLVNLMRVIEEGRT
jgi:hypothetical protein